MSEKSRFKIGLGIPSILLILLVLILMLLGIVALMEARADESLCLKSAVLTQAYYEAEAQVQNVLSQLDDAICMAGRQASDAQSYAELLAQIEQVANTQLAWSDGGYISFEVDAQSERAIVVSLYCEPWSQTMNKRFSIIKHNLTDKSDWSLSEPVKLIGM